MSPAFKTAMQLLGQDPLPADTETQLEALEKQIDPEEYERFGDLWAAFETARDRSDETNSD